MDPLLELLQRKEPLLDELKPYVFDSEGGVRMLSHPLVIEVFFDPERSARVNQFFRYKQQAKAKALADRDWHNYVFLHERPYRVDAFTDIADMLGNEDYWTLLRTVYVDSENVWQHREDWYELVGSGRAKRDLFSSDDVQCVFSLPPEQGGLLPTTVIYRGFRHDEDGLDDGLDGLSWTLDLARAKWFARRFPHKGGVAMIAKATVDAEHVLAYITDRGEQEIVVLPWHVSNVTVEEIEEGAGDGNTD